MCARICLLTIAVIGLVCCCSQCALDHYVKDTKCFSCRKATSGIFNTATELISVLKKRAATGKDPRAELEAAERERLAEKAAVGGATIA